MHPDAEHQRPPRQHRLVERVVDRHPAHLARARPGGGTADKLEQRHAEILKDAVQAGLRANGHATKLPADLQRYGVTHSVLVVTAASWSASGVTPMPGPDGTSRCPSDSTNGSVMSVL